jgi:hypothetical protein
MICFICDLVATAPTPAGSDPEEAHRAGIASGALIVLAECLAGDLVDVHSAAAKALCDHHRGWLHSLVGLVKTIEREERGNVT